jgi:predicted nucleic acid-binding protein
VPACLLDVNVWLAAAFSAHPAHGAARRVVTTATAIEPALWCRATQQSFLRLASTPVISGCSGIQTPSFRSAFPEPPHTS